LILSNYENKISTADQLKILDLIKGWFTYKLVNGFTMKITLLYYIKLMIRYDKPLTTSEISYLFNTNNEIRKEVFLLIQNLYIIEANNL
jgi:hypothetical protein